VSRKPTLVRGARTYLRRPTLADAAEYCTMIRESRALHRPWVYASSDPAAFRNYVRNASRDDYAGLLVCRRSDDAIAGVFNVSQMVRGGFQSAYMGYYAAAAHARQGYMAEGLELVLRYVFQTLRLHRLEANIQPGNTASIELVRGAGFRLEGFSPRYLKIGGRWRDHQRWAIVADDWRARRRGA